MQQIMYQNWKLQTLSSPIMRLNIHTKIAKKLNSSIAKLIDSVDSVQSHLSNDVLLSRNFDEFTKYEQIQK